MTIGAKRKLLNIKDQNRTQYVMLFQKQCNNILGTKCNNFKKRKKKNTIIVLAIPRQHPEASGLSEMNLRKGRKDGTQLPKASLQLASREYVMLFHMEHLDHPLQRPNRPKYAVVTSKEKHVASSSLTHN